MSAEQITALWESLSPLVVSYALRIVGVLILLWIAFRIARWAGNKVTSSLEARELDVGLSRFFGAIARWGIIVASVLGCLGMFGVETTSFAAVIGAAGLAVGLAFQGTLSNFAAGVMILVFRPFAIGHYIKGGGREGTVTDIGLFMTSIDTPDNRRIIVPNSDLANKALENVSFHDKRRCDVNVGVIYTASVPDTRAALQKVIERIDEKLDGEDHVVKLIGLGDSSVDWSVRIWVRTSDYWPVQEKMLELVKDALEEANIDIPFPNLEVHFLNELQTKAA
jgi:small conductance mechanosensitive channel